MARPAAAAKHVFPTSQADYWCSFSMYAHVCAGKDRLLGTLCQQLLRRSRHFFVRNILMQLDYMLVSPRIGLYSMPSELLQLTS